MAEWRNGGMAEWRNGGMAEWHNVWYEIVWNQDTESTQMPPWRSPSWLVLFKIIIILSNINWISIFVNIIHRRRKIAFRQLHIWLQHFPMFTDKFRIFWANIIRAVTSGLRRERFALITLAALDQTLSEGADVAGMVKNSFASCASSGDWDSLTAQYFSASLKFGKLSNHRHL